MGGEETVLTTRRALLRSPGGGWTAGRLRLSDRAVRFTAADGTGGEVPLGAVTSVRVARRPRAALVLTTPDGPLRLRCFGVPAVAALLRGQAPPEG